MLLIFKRDYFPNFSFELTLCTFYVLYNGNIYSDINYSFSYKTVLKKKNNKNLMIDNIRGILRFIRLLYYMFSK